MRAKMVNRQLWAYLSLKGELMPSTIREKPGDAESARDKTFEWIMHGRHHPERYKLVRVSVTVEEGNEDGKHQTLND